MVKPKKQPTKTTDTNDGYVQIIIHRKGQPVKKIKEIIPKTAKSMTVPL